MVQHLQLLPQQRSLVKSPNSNCSHLINTNFNANIPRLDSSTFHIDSINNNNTSAVANATTTTTTTQSALGQPSKEDDDNKDQVKRAKKKSIKRNTSLMTFKPFDFHIKSIYSGLRKKSRSETPRSNGTSSSGASTNVRQLPYLRVETVDTDESQNPLLVTFPQSSYQQRGSLDKSSLQLLDVSQYDVSRSHASSPFLSPGSGNIRRSSTSDIMCKKSSGASSSTDSRRPSTSDLLRRARERKDSDAGGRMGRSVSHGGLPRGGARGGRRTSVAY